MQSSDEKERRLHRRLVTVIEVAGDLRRVDPFAETQVDHVLERLASRTADEVRKPSSRSASERSGESRWMSAV